MMDFDTWKEGLAIALSRIADRDFQVRSWLKGEGEQISSFDECISALYDDFDFEKFIETYRGRTNDSTLMEDLDRFCKILEQFLAELPHTVHDAEMIDDSRWVKIRKTVHPLAARMKDLRLLSDDATESRPSP